MPKTPLVTIVALSYNHGRFLRLALDSILAQTYPRLEVILVDDGSTDDSAAIMREYAAAHPGWQLVLLPENVGNCAAFNRAFRQSQGEFLLDFATDDVLLPERVARQVAYFQTLPPDYGLVYGNVELLSEAGESQRLFHAPDARGQLHPRPAEGWVFGDVLGRFFISAPSMMMRRATLAALGGYDETLSYEDFDFWVRASRDWRFGYQNEVLTQKRLHPRSKSAQGYRPHDPLVASTVRVCRKAARLCRTSAERAALAARVRWELRQAVRFGSFGPGRAFYALLCELRAVRPLDWALGQYARVRG